MKKKILLVAGVLFGLLFVNAGLNKFFNYMPVPDDLPEPVMNRYGQLHGTGMAIAFDRSGGGGGRRLSTGFILAAFSV